MKTPKYRLIDAWVDGSISSTEMDRLRKLLLADQSAREYLRSLATVDFGLRDLASSGELDSVVGSEADAFPTAVASRHSWFKLFGHQSWIAVVVVAGLAGVLLSGMLLQSFFNPRRELSEVVDDRDDAPHIVKVTDVTGAVYWTGGGGRVMDHLQMGDMLAGGTMECASPTSWIKVEFLDGTEVFLSGDSRLTYSDFGQKILFLHQGKCSAIVRPQDKDLPMLLNTKMAELQVLGTEFTVATNIDETALDVSEGEVRIRQRGTGRAVPVSRNQQAIASTDDELTVSDIPSAKANWTCRIDLGGQGLHGKWMAAADNRPSQLQVAPYLYTTPLGDSMLVYVAAAAPANRVHLLESSVIKVCGFSKRVTDILFGVSVQTADGTVKGNYMALPQNLDVSDDGSFEMILPVSQLRPDPALAYLNADVPKTPKEMMVECVWCSTQFPKSGLSVTSVEISE